MAERSGTWGMANNFQEPGEVIGGVGDRRLACPPVDRVIKEGFRPSLAKIQENQELADLVVKVSCNGN